MIINYEKAERKALIRFILFMLRNMSTKKLHETLTAVIEIYKR